MTADTRVSERIREIRAALNLSQKELAARLQVSGSSLSDVENGKYPPNFELIRGLVDEFKVNIYYLLFGQGEMFIEPGKDQFRKLKVLANRNEGIRKFLFYFEHSAIFRYIIMGNAEEVLIENFQRIDKEIKAKKKELNPDIDEEISLDA
jgi:transcriptional regulator with XRE-family HTH domain